MEEEKKEVVEQPTVEETVAEQPVEEAQPVAEEPVVYGEPKKKKPVLLVLIICLVLAAAIATIILLQPSKKSNKDDEKKIVTPKEEKSDYRMTGNSLEKFDLAFLKLENTAVNKVYSPLSIKYAMEMLAEGTNGETRAQLDAVIGDYKAKKYDNNSNMSFANALFIRNTLESSLKSEYKETLTSKYNAEVIVDSFESPAVINNWVKEKTLNLIDKAVDTLDDKDFVLTNALGIDMKWNYQIHCSAADSKDVPCYNGGTYDVNYQHEKLQGEKYEYSHIEYPYIDKSSYESINFNGKENIMGAKVLASFNKYDAVKTIGEAKIKEEVGKAFEEWLKTEEATNFSYTIADKEPVVENYIKELNKNYGKAASSTDFMLYDDENVKGFAKDLKTYNGTTLEYVAIMPKTESLASYVEKVTPEDINKVINNLKDMKIENFEEGYVTLIEGDIPMFKYDFEMDLIKELNKVGITDVFDSAKADLSGMLEDSKGYSIVEAKHKAVIEFSNQGIKAAAFTIEGGFGNTGGGFNYLYEVPTKRINLTFDKPYLYLIRDKVSGEVWFVGTVYEPITKTAAQ